MACRQQHGQRLPVTTTTRRQEMIVGEGLPRRADGVQGVALGPGAPQRPLGPTDLHHPLAPGLEERGQPDAVAAGTLHRPATPTRHLGSGDVVQATIAGRIGASPMSGRAGGVPGRWRRRPECRGGVAADHAVDGAGQPAHRHGLLPTRGLVVSAWRTPRGTPVTGHNPRGLDRLLIRPARRWIRSTPAPRQTARHQGNPRAPELL
jgi:hypothetical protein